VRLQRQLRRRLIKALVKPVSKWPAKVGHIAAGVCLLRAIERNVGRCRKRFYLGVGHARAPRSRRRQCVTNAAADSAWQHYDLIY
jgi:hypothetical protein